MPLQRKREPDSTESLSEVRLPTQLLTLMDGFDRKGKRENDDCHVIIFAVINRLDALIRLCRPGRFDREIIFEPPDSCTRTLILCNLLKDLIWVQWIWTKLEGIVLDTFQLIWRPFAQEVSMQHDNTLCTEDFIAAMKRRSILHRQYQAALDNWVTWNDIAGIDPIKPNWVSIHWMALLQPETYTSGWDWCWGVSCCTARPMQQDDDCEGDC